MSSHRRALMTATGAGAVLCALLFVPSAKATPDAPGTGGARHAATSYPDSSSYPRDSADGRAHRTSAGEEPGQDGFTSPFVLSALGVAGAGGAMIARARRRRTG
nr:hypothetical protein [Streptomyces bathyalis]